VGADDRQDRPEDLLARDPHGRLDAIQDARADQEAAPIMHGGTPIEDDLGAFAASDVDVAGHALEVLAGDDRAHVDLGAAFGRAAPRCRRSTRASATPPTGIATLPAMQRSPAQPKAESWSAPTAWSRSASGMTIRWFFAPPAAWTRLPFRVPVS